MDPQVGQIAYDEDAALKLGFTDYPDTDQMQTEILLYDQKDDDDSKTFEDAEGENAGRINCPVNFR